MKTLRWLTFAYLLLLTGCAAWAPPTTFEQKIAYGYATHTAVLNAAASGVETHTLSVPDARQVLKLADESRILLDSARSAGGAGDIKTAEGQLELATAVLTQLQTYLRNHNGR